jgi:hypothetical protein
MEFFTGIAQNLIADFVIVLVGLVTAWVIARRLRWRMLGTIFRLQKNGISNVYLDRSEYISRRSMSVLQFIETTERNFTYVGIYFSLATDQARIDATIRNLVSRRCMVQIVLLDEDAHRSTFNYLETHFALAPNTLRGRVRHAKEYFVQLRDGLGINERTLLNIRTHNLPITTSAFIIDSNEKNCRMLVDIKWYGLGRDRSLGIEFAGQPDEGGIFKNLLSSFERIVQESTPLVEPPQ